MEPGVVVDELFDSLLVVSSAVDEPRPNSSESTIEGFPSSNRLLDISPVAASFVAALAVVEVGEGAHVGPVSDVDDNIGAEIRNHSPKPLITIIGYFGVGVGISDDEVSCWYGCTGRGLGTEGGKLSLEGSEFRTEGLNVSTVPTALSVVTL